MYAQVDATIPLRFNPTPPAQVQDPLRMMMEVQRIRNLRMQEEIQAQELRRMKTENDARASALNDARAKALAARPPVIGTAIVPAELLTLGL